MSEKIGEFGLQSKPCPTSTHDPAWVQQYVFCEGADMGTGPSASISPWSTEEECWMLKAVAVPIATMMAMPVTTRG